MAIPFLYSERNTNATGSHGNRGRRSRQGGVQILRLGYICRECSKGDSDVGNNDEDMMIVRDIVKETESKDMAMENRQ